MNELAENRQLHATFPLSLDGCALLAFGFRL
jgi:hypothetical protein